MDTDWIYTDKKIIKTDKTFYLDKRGFLYLKIINQKKYKNFKAEQLKIYMIFAARIIKEKPMPLLIDLRNITGVLSSSTFSLLAKDARLKSNFTKIAFVVNSLPIKLMIHNYIRIYKPNITSRVLKTIEQGIDYLLYKPQNTTWK